MEIVKIGTARRTTQKCVTVCNNLVNVTERIANLYIKKTETQPKGKEGVQTQEDLIPTITIFTIDIKIKMVMITIFSDTIHTTETSGIRECQCEEI